MIPATDGLVQRPLLLPPGMMMHPAWAAVIPLLGGRARYHDWEMALAFAVAGYIDDLVVFRDEAGNPTGYEFPEILIPDRDDDLPVEEAFALHLAEAHALARNREFRNGL